jgi:hypothetical protein
MNPLIVLGPARSYTTVVTAMLGQHPEMYAFPETHLLMTRTIAEWSVLVGEFYSHGLLRLVAELIAGVQTEAAIRLARLWLMRRLSRPSAWVFCELAERISPRTPIEKSPLMVRNIRSLVLAHGTFPDAHFLHLTRHPVSYGFSILKFVDQMLTSLRLDGRFASEMLLRSPISPFMCHTSAGVPVVDPQTVWYREHSNILAFLAHVPRLQQMRVRGEDLLTNPDLVLRQISGWLGLRSDRDAIHLMKHPEKWAFASVGPRNAVFGSDPDFCRDPVLRPRRRGHEGLDDPLPWRADNTGINQEVRRLAEQFGYA